MRSRAIKPGFFAYYLVAAQILPGRDAAILTIDDGKTINLDPISGKITEFAENKSDLLTYQQNTKENIRYHRLTMIILMVIKAFH